ncbi:MAG: DUF1513 domain-containing protein [Burkholderiaceae bacterium]|nr:DUF1513 domain-containing protein [Burkholderiaceae bacterium]
METDRPLPVQRRQWLQAMAMLATVPLVPATARAAAGGASSQATQSLAAAWMQGEQMRVGIVQPAAHAGQPLRIRQALDVPTRAHGMAALRDGSVVFASRRPGDWLVRLRPGQAADAAQWLWIEPDRVFNGHVIESADGRHVYTTETDLEDAQGLIGVRDAGTLEKIAEWRTGGMDPHQLLMDADGTLMVANGGIPTQSETGRRKLQLDHMDSCIARLLPAEGGAIGGLWKLDDNRLSLRHLAWGPRVAHAPRRRWLGIALQAEHRDAQARAAAPVLALFDGERLHAVPLPAGHEPLAGYGGDIGCDGELFAVSCPRVNTISWWAVPDHREGHGRWLRGDAMAGVYSVANASVSLDARGRSLPADPALWMGGTRQAELRQRARVRHTASVPGMALDNHWIALSRG